MAASSVAIWELADSSARMRASSSTPAGRGRGGVASGWRGASLRSGERAAGGVAGGAAGRRTWAEAALKTSRLSSTRGGLKGCISGTRAGAGRAAAAGAAAAAAGRWLAARDRLTRKSSSKKSAPCAGRGVAAAGLGADAAAAAAAWAWLRARCRVATSPAGNARISTPPLAARLESTTASGPSSSFSMRRASRAVWAK